MTEAVRGPILLGLARAALDGGDETAQATAERVARAHFWLRELGASFVTLRIDGELRGCIGSIDARRALGEDVARNALAAAYRDPRFPPVSTDELPVLQVEVSVLSPRVPMLAASEAEALAQLRPGIDGLAFEYGSLSATFLPQVWESLSAPDAFLEQLRKKAGLPGRFWHPDVRLSRYTVEKYA
jgi:AmmeMemoRadiSam system protein A